MSATLFGKRWSGERLTLTGHAELGLEGPDLIGWSDFYGGGPSKIHVAYASSGSRAGFLVWGGNLGLRVLPAGASFAPGARDDLPALPLLWLPDPGHLPAQVRAAIRPLAPGRRLEGSPTSAKAPLV